MKSTHKLRLFLLASTLLAAPSAFAATINWMTSGTNNSWSAPSAWIGNTAPAILDDVVFTSTTGTNTNTYLGGADRTIQSLSFNGGTTDPNFTITLGNGSGTASTAARSLTFSSINTGITIGANNSANHIIGTGGATGSFGSLNLLGNLTVTHNSTGTLTIDRPITGAFNLTKAGSGSGSLILSGANTYTGPTAVDTGTLVVTGTLTSAVTVANGATLLGSGTTTGTLTLDSGSLIVGAATGSSFRASAVTATGAASVKIAGSDGSGTIGSHTIGVVRYATGTGPDVANFSTAGYHVGATVANVGAAGGETQLTYTNQTRTWNSAAATWDAMTTSAWQEDDNRFGHGDVVIFDGTGTGGGSARAVTLDSLVTPGSVTFNNASDTPYTVSGNGAIGGLTGLTKSGDGLLTLSTANTYTGLTTVSGGTLRLGHANNTLTGAITISGSILDVDNPDTVGAVTLTSGTISGDSVLTGTSYTVSSGTVSTVLAGTGSALTKDTGGTVELSAANTYSGSTTISNGSLTLNHNLALQNSALVTTSGAVTLGTGITTPTFGGLSGATGDLATFITGYGSVTSLTLNPNAGSVTYGGAIANGAANMNLVKSGGGTQVLSNTNTYSGATTISGGTLQLGSGGTTGALTGTTSITNNGNLTVNRSNDFTQATDLNGNIISGSGSFTQAGTSTSITTLSLANSYTGSTTVSTGTLVVGSNAPSNTNGALGKATSEVVLGVSNGPTSASLLIGGAFTVGRDIRIPTNNTSDNGARVLTLGGNTADDSVFSGNIFLGTTNQAGKGLTLTAANGGQVTFSGVIQNPSGMDPTSYTVTKSGLGTVVLSNANTYTGATTVSAGTLLVNGTHITATASSGYTVAANSTLGGTGRLAVNGNVSVGSTGILAPGASIGTLTLDGINTAGAVLTMTTDSEFGYELAGNGGTPDQLDFRNYLAGDLVLNGNTIDLSLLGTQAAGTYNVDIMRFFSGGIGTATTHTFTTGNLTIGTLGAGISSASIDWNGTGDNNETIALTYTVVPEPRAALLGGLGVLALLRRRRN